MITQAFSNLHNWWLGLWPAKPLLVINTALWQEIVAELGRRGLNGQRESGAFLLTESPGDQQYVTQVEYFDDLDPNCLVGSIHFHQSGYRQLAKLCNRAGLRVVADVHTHPGINVAQSYTDQSNPMVARPGHIAIIVPNYGTRPVNTREIGVHQYEGQLGWQSWFGRDAARTIRIRRAKNDRHKRQ